jgi:hypothetical protein
VKSCLCASAGSPAASLVRFGDFIVNFARLGALDDVYDRMASVLMLTDVEREHLLLIRLGRPPEARYRKSVGSLRAFSMCWTRWIRHPR